MKIGNIDLGDRPVVLAPMEDVTDTSFRLICKEMGADMTYTEFVSADALIRNIAATTRKLHINYAERPTAIQIYGRDVDAMVEAARIAEAAGPDILDINFGCPVKKVAGKGAGAGMLREPQKMIEITRAVVDAVHLPVTVKTRTGWDHDNRIIVDLAEALQDCGIAAITVHGRTRSQMYTGTADWRLIGEVKRNPRLHIPIIGNGDIASGQDALRAFDTYGVDAVMVGRATFGRPWIFKEIRDTLDGGDHRIDRVIDSRYAPMTAQWMLDVLKEQVRASVERIEEYRGILHVRRHLADSPLFKGIANFRPTRIAMLRAETVDELFAIMEGIRPLLPE